MFKVNSNDNKITNEKQIQTQIKNHVSKSISPKLIRKQRNLNAINNCNAYNNDNYYYYSSYSNNEDENRVNFTNRKPCVGVTPESRSRKTPNLNIIRSTRMPNNVSLDCVVVTDKYNNKIILPVAKF